MYRQNEYIGTLNDPVRMRYYLIYGNEDRLVPFIEQYMTLKHCSVGYRQAFHRNLVDEHRKLVRRFNSELP